MISQKQTLRIREVIASMAMTASAEPQPIPRRLALEALKKFPDAHPAFFGCWPWTKGKSRDRPIMLTRPLPPAHPVRLFLGLHDGKLKRISRMCPTSTCVNPAHWYPIPREPSRPMHPLAFEAEGQLEELRPKSFMAALQMLNDEVPPHFTVQAYRNLRQQGVLRAY